MRKLNASIIVGIIIAIIGAGTVLAYGRNVDQRVLNGRQAKTVLVATQPLTSGMSTSAIRSDVHAEQVPAAFAVDSSLSKLSDVPDGQVLLSSVPKGGQLSSSSFGDPAEAGKLSPATGDVALAVETDLSPGVARYLTPGQLVDVFVTYNEIQGQPVASNRTKLFVSGVKVLAISVAQSQSSSTSSSHGAFGKASASQDQAVAQDKVIAVLDLHPGDAERLVNAQALGTIYLGYTLKGGDSTPTGVNPDDVVRSNR